MPSQQGVHPSGRPVPQRISRISRLPGTGACAREHKNLPEGAADRGWHRVGQVLWDRGFQSRFPAEIGRAIRAGLVGTQAPQRAVP